MKIHLGIAAILLAGNAFAQPLTHCSVSGRLLFYHPGHELNGFLGAGFADSLFKRLASPLPALGYCLSYPIQTSLGESHSDNLGLWISARPEADKIRVLAAILPENQSSNGMIQTAMERPLTELVFQNGDLEAAPSFFGQKVVENLRTQYVAQLNISTDPDSAVIRSNRGLEGISPLEWVLPLGSLHVSVSRKGYLTRQYDLDLSRPGEHSATLPLIKRHFYHSRLFPITLAFVATSLGAYYIENEYYNSYHQLGLEDQRTRPERFEKLFSISQNWERVAAASLAGALFTFGLSFRF